MAPPVPMQRGRVAENNNHPWGDCKVSEIFNKSAIIKSFVLEGAGWADGDATAAFNAFPVVNVNRF